MSKRKATAAPMKMNELFTPRMKRRIWLARPENDGVIAHHARKRHAAKMKRVPDWADLDAIRAVYLEAAKVTKETGIAHHVDHVFPLQGPTVCGLHVQHNLRVLPAAANQKKHAQLPDDPEAWTALADPVLAPVLRSSVTRPYRDLFPNSIVRARRSR